LTHKVKKSWFMIRFLAILVAQGIAIFCTPGMGDS
jgi:hypothetical protein